MIYEPPRRIGDAVIGRRLGLQDIPTAVGWFEDETLCRFTPFPDRLASPSHWQAALTSPTRTEFWLMLGKSGEAIGLSSFTMQGERSDRIFTGTVVGRPAAWGTGLGTAIKGWQIAHLFARTDVAEMCSMVNSNNGAMVRILEKFGFRDDGDNGRTLPECLSSPDFVTLKLRRADWLERAKNGTSQTCAGLALGSGGATAPACRRATAQVR